MDPGKSFTFNTRETITPADNWRPQEASSYEPVAINVSFCRVSGTIEGNIGLELWLPLRSQWNGRLLGTGVGGDAGVFNFTDMGQRLNEGFASFSTDSGHKRSGDPRWMADPKARQDYTHRAVHQATLAAKRLVRQFYGEAQQYSYFLGCSGGGRQGMKEMQTYPGDFDGIVSGGPAPYMPLQSVRMMWFALQQKQSPEAALTNEDWDLYETAATQHCDARDGVTDGVVENIAACDFDPAVLACSGGEDACLSTAKLQMLQQIIRPMVDEQGQPMDRGLFSGVRTRQGPPSPLLRAMWADGVYDDPQWNEDGFQRTRDLALVNDAMPELRADSTYIDEYLEGGGKAIIYQGWSDPSTVAGLAIDYYRQLSATYGGVEALSDSVRLFLVPGMYHCRRGPGADQFGGSRHQTWPGDGERDILWSMIHWVEQGVAPDHLVASKLDGEDTRFTRKICPFPQSAVYDGKADENAHQSFHCEDDPVLEVMLQ
ncbi:tannase/feruloyl esterase family alpha/beta hydrolase [Parahaliea maris]|uniref:tannase/feruloyl esterase family alpha/beta hydrolase n=1 Tax=Parahaliea maris TaxID=2716870 RepID=UPI001BB333B2|nr:tannase/feruloyl esterase family alpha/beta hydrolase [Parahaliea maris]